MWRVLHAVFVTLTFWTALSISFAFFYVATWKTIEKIRRGE